MGMEPGLPRSPLVPWLPGSASLRWLTYIRRGEMRSSCLPSVILSLFWRNPWVESRLTRGKVLTRGRVFTRCNVFTSVSMHGRCQRIITYAQSPQSVLHGLYHHHQTEIPTWNECPYCSRWDPRGSQMIVSRFIIITSFVPMCNNPHSFGNPMSRGGGSSSSVRGQCSEAGDLSTPKYDYAQPSGRTFNHVSV
ncbi:hypothetical protein N658DRAFT_258660 [Parathielavia hyrcaniae]|uniref:Uncharacterized protein n=1 Tax=Parathielavia hyrcaniae TaxID=113614 RepID=A0AAN6SYT6_9PEZI|nr:hypothetical protein N658DRAFT_258660 [Parathielavia hyrcaniae]